IQALELAAGKREPHDRANASAPSYLPRVRRHRSRCLRIAREPVRVSGLRAAAQLPRSAAASALVLQLRRQESRTGIVDAALQAGKRGPFAAGGHDLAGWGGEMGFRRFAAGSL